MSSVVLAARIKELEDQLKKQRGGRREGSGRPSTLTNPKRITIWLEADELTWIKSQGKQSEVIRQLINTKRREG